MPCDYKKYPPNWKTEIRPRILERDGHCCKFCGVPNYAIIAVHPLIIGRLPLAEVVGQPPFTAFRQAESLDDSVGDLHVSTFILNLLKKQDHIVRYFRVVLTIAHLHDPDPMNCEDENLAALCQKCHNAHDKPMRLANSKETRERKRKEATGQMDLF